VREIVWVSMGEMCQRDRLYAKERERVCVCVSMREIECERERSYVCEKDLKNTSLFCKRALQKGLSSAKETYHFKESTNRSHPI